MEPKLIEQPNNPPFLIIIHHQSSNQTTSNYPSKTIEQQGKGIQNQSRARKKKLKIPTQNIESKC